jgi:drug/metabolite transporter (DMT)-like permease
MKLSPTLPLPASSRGVVAPWPNWVLQTVFLLTGVWSTLSIQSISNRGGTNCPAFVPICNYTGYMLVPFLVRSHSGESSILSEKANIMHHIRSLFASATLDVLATNLSVGGIALAGSGLFQVSYSSIVVVTAIFARIFLRKLMNKAQWIAIVTVFAGLLITAGDLSGGFNGSFFFFSVSHLLKYFQLVHSQSDVNHPFLTTCVCVCDL